MAGADAVGLVFVGKSPRHVSIDEARAVIAALPAFVVPVGLFVDAALADVRQITAAVNIRTVQLHGCELPADTALLTDLRVIKAVNLVDARHAAWLTSPAPPNVVGLLIDAPPADGALTGGGGETFDWAALDALDRAKLPPLILAGGLTPGNVVSAITRVRPYAVDVSSGVESSRGVKDPAKIAAFCDAVRHAR
jgi:phosphoribosylanthranilate isomerase